MSNNNLELARAYWTHTSKAKRQTMLYKTGADMLFADREFKELPVWIQNNVANDIINQSIMEQQKEALEMQQYYGGRICPNCED